MGEGKFGICYSAKMIKYNNVVRCVKIIDKEKIKNTELVGIEAAIMKKIVKI